jgi:alpha-galactosidase
VLVLDTTRPDVQAHIAGVAHDLVAAGYPYLKLDFTYAPALAGTYADAGLTPAQRVRAGYDAVRRGAGEDAFLLGCGAPIAPCVGVVDGMRIGADVAPWWSLPSGYQSPPGYPATSPATAHAWSSTLTRAFLHRKLWLNDPDCVMLRADATDLSREQAHAWALAVAMSGGMALVSDDLARLDADARRQFDEVIALGREVDTRARDHGETPRCADLLDRSVPHRLEAAGMELVGDPEAGTASLQPHLL